MTRHVTRHLAFDITSNKTYSEKCEDTIVKTGVMTFGITGRGSNSKYPIFIYIYIFKSNAIISITTYQHYYSNNGIKYQSHNGPSMMELSIL